MKCSPEKKRRQSSTPGCQTIPWTAVREFRVAIKGPLTTPVGGGIRSLNVALRQILDLYCLRSPGEVLQGGAFAREAS